MSEQKFILDATAGFRMMWFDKNHPYTVFMDKRTDEEIMKLAKLLEEK